LAITATFYQHEQIYRRKVIKFMASNKLDKNHIAPAWYLISCSPFCFFGFLEPSDLPSAVSVTPRELRPSGSRPLLDSQSQGVRGRLTPMLNPDNCSLDPLHRADSNSARHHEALSIIPGQPLRMVRHPIGRFGHSEEIAAVVLYLCSPGAAFITGTALPVDGGVLA
jgi:hypothetical protein